MLLHIVTGSQTPPVEGDRTQYLWAGGYGMGDGDGADQLPASILAAGTPSLELGTWYSLDEFAKRIGSGSEAAEPAVWTTVSIRVQDVDEGRDVDVLVDQRLAAFLICEAVLAHLATLGVGEHTWVRIQ